jgi:hypothetical protein
MQQSSTSSIKVSAVTRRRVSSLARRLKLSNQEQVIDRALDLLERSLFWEGFDDEAKAYLARYPQESNERMIFGQISGDGLNG